MTIRREKLEGNTIHTKLKLAIDVAEGGPAPPLMHVAFPFLRNTE